MKKTAINLVTIAALFFSVMLHAALIGGLAYAAGMFPSKQDAYNKETKTSNRNSAYALLPDVEIISQESSLKKNENTEKTVTDPESFGKAGAQAVESSDNTDKSVFSFEDAVKRRIQEARMYPVDAKRTGTQGTAKVAFTLTPDGGVSSVNVVSSSGDKILDDEAVSTIKRASPYPVFPESIKSNKMDLQIAIVFKLN